MQTNDSKKRPNIIIEGAKTEKGKKVEIKSELLLATFIQIRIHDTPKKERKKCMCVLYGVLVLYIHTNRKKQEPNHDK